MPSRFLPDRLDPAFRVSGASALDAALAPDEYGPSRWWTTTGHRLIDRTALTHAAMTDDPPMPVLTGRQHAENVALQRLAGRLGAALEGYDKARTPEARQRANTEAAAVRREAWAAGVADEIEHLATRWSAQHYGGPKHVTIGQVLSRWAIDRNDPSDEDLTA
jgi:hypothetical protein